MAIFGSILVQKKAVHKDDRNVVTSQRRDVESTYKEVNKRQRREAPMSRRQHELFLSIIKRQRETEFEGGSEIGNRTNQGTEIRAAVTSISKKSP